MNPTPNPQFAIGTRFRSRGKHPRECVIIDILRTYNAKGELVRVRYVAEHAFLGNAVIDHDVTEFAVAVGLIH